MCTCSELFCEGALWNHSFVSVHRPLKQNVKTQSAKKWLGERWMLINDLSFWLLSKRNKNETSNAITFVSKYVAKVGKSKYTKLLPNFSTRIWRLDTQAIEVTNSWVSNGIHFSDQVTHFLTFRDSFFPVYVRTK